MEAILQQLGGLLLGSIPTIIILTLLYVIYKSVVHKSLEHVLEQRHSQTEGAVEKARANISAAEARTAEYEQRLREARMAVFKQQEARRQQALQARAAAVSEARARAQKHVGEARAAIEHDKSAAQSSLQTEASKLASEIIRIVLQPVAVSRTPAGAP